MESLQRLVEKGGLQNSTSLPLPPLPTPIPTPIRTLTPTPNLQPVGHLRAGLFAQDPERLRVQLVIRTRQTAHGRLAGSEWSPATIGSCDAYPRACSSYNHAAHAAACSILPRTDIKCPAEIWFLCLMRKDNFGVCDV